MEAITGRTFGYAPKMIMNSEKTEVRGIIFVIESSSGEGYNLN